MSDKKLPGFLVLGVPKAGTTSLYQYLVQHPALYLPEQKELHYFSSAALQAAIAGPGDQAAIESGVVTDWDDYAGRFAAASSDQLCGEVSPSYFYFAADAYPQIRQALGDIKVIVMLRDPIERAYSNYLHLRSEGRETLSFEAGLASEAERQQAGFGDFWRYLDHSRYAEKCAATVNAFGSDNVLFILTESLRDDTLATLRTVYRFLGVDDTFEPDTGTSYNTSKQYRDTPLTRLLLGQGVLKKLVRGLVPQQLWMRLKQIRAQQLNKYQVPPPPLTPAAAATIRHELEADVAAVADYVDVTRWRTFQQQTAQIEPGSA